MDQNLKWIQKGNTGCVFATFLSRHPKIVGWKRIFNPSKLTIPKNTYLISLIFEGKNKEWVRQWCLKNGFYEEKIDNDLIGLRYKTEHGISWVQYFGPDSHVKTRQAINSEILFTVKLPIKSYFKVSINAILHLAHASVDHIPIKLRNKFWENSYKQSKKIIGHQLTIEEAAKTTWKI